jgi:hypothetical protein
MPPALFLFSITMSSNLTQPAAAPYVLFRALPGHCSRVCGSASTVDAASPDSKGKGKGKAPVQDQPMEEDVAEGDDDGDEDEGDEDEDEEEDEAEVCRRVFSTPTATLLPADPIIHL